LQTPYATHPHFNQNRMNVYLAAAQKTALKNAHPAALDSLRRENHRRNASFGSRRKAVYDSRAEIRG
jgi:hypothetical protein